MKTALIIVDMQQSLVDNGPWKADELIRRVKGLVDSARAAGAPVVFVADRRVKPDPGLLPSLQSSDTDTVVEKGYCDSFLETSLDAGLKAKGIDQLVVVGVQTDYCIDTTCRSGASHGYKVLLVGDAHSTFDHEHLAAEQIIAHHNRVLRNLPAGRGSVSVVDARDVKFA